MFRSLLEAVAGGEAVFVDLGSVTFMDSSGLAALIVAVRTATAGGIPLQLRAVSARVMKLLTITGMDGLLPGEAAAEAPTANC